eukprot:scaffold2879_cov269-Prasinococcus_capsulatus_cf.AAC.42
MAASRLYVVVAWILVDSGYRWRALASFAINGSTTPPPPRFCILSDDRSAPAAPIYARYPVPGWRSFRRVLLVVALCSATPERFLEEVDKLHQEALANGTYNLYNFFPYDRDSGHSVIGIPNVRSACPRFPLWTSYDWVSAGG